MNNVLSKQIGPFPLGAWLIIGAAGAGVALLAGRSKSIGGQNPNSVQPVAFDQSAVPDLSGGGTGAAIDAPSWSDVFDAYREGWTDNQSVQPGLTPPEWDTPTAPSLGGTTPPMTPTPVPTREPVASIPVQLPPPSAPAPASIPLPQKIVALYENKNAAGEVVSVVKAAAPNYSPAPAGFFKYVGTNGMVFQVDDTAQNRSGVAGKGLTVL